MECTCHVTFYPGFCRWLSVPPPLPWKVSACRGEMWYQKEGVAWKGGRGGVFRWRGTEVRWRGAFGVRARSLMVRKCDEHANPSHPLDVFLFVSGVWSMDGVETGGREFSLGQIQPYRLGIWNFFFDRYQIGERNNLYFLPCPMEHAGHP